MFKTALISAALLVATLAAPLAISAEVTLKVHHFLGSESLPHTSLIEPWARQVEKDSAGRIKVEIYPAMEFGGKAPELVDQVQKGVVDIIWTAAAYTPGRFPRTEVFTLPLVHRGNPVATNLAIVDLLNSGLAADFDGVKPLLAHVHSGHAIHLGHRSAAKLADFEGMVLRPAGRGVGLWTVEALGAGPTKKRHPKLPKALENAALDGALMSFQLANTMGVVDAVKTHTMLEGGDVFGTSLYLFLMNQTSYDALDAELRSVIDRNSGAKLAQSAGRAWREAADAAIDTAKKRGNKINTLDADQPEVQTALNKVSTRWAKSVEQQQIDGQKLLMQAREAISRHSQPLQ